MISDNNSIDFDLSEIVAELELSARKIKPLKPLKSGDKIHDLVLVKTNVNKQRFLKGTIVNSSVLLRQFSGKPLVICFYSSQWQDYGLYYLRQLNAIHREIEAFGANLLIVSHDEGSKHLEQTIWDNSLSLDFYFDLENVIARKFGIYSDEDPAWNKYPGIDVNVPLLAVYILNSDNQIIFDHIDRHLEQSVLPSTLLDALNASLSISPKRKSA